MSFFRRDLSSLTSSQFQVLPTENEDHDAKEPGANCASVQMGPLDRSENAVGFQHVQPLKARGAIVGQRAHVDTWIPFTEGSLLIHRSQHLPHTWPSRPAFSCPQKAPLKWKPPVQMPDGCITSVLGKVCRLRLDLPASSLSFLEYERGHMKNVKHGMTC